ncbi:DUF1522 domain-containing protein [Methylobacterium sp. WL8]|uniref:DUF1522 domain-containing protein n=1 Tax=Methylobacterium sp. WL8 TaxID=2603899 RepID=UPI0011CB10FB|nr:DUF1522 domain-containing protein [Methylobacterium sp. WL8]TXN78341.1 DUF1522 domain-containing protein [Methylobacterium sp. WL8]
MSSGITLSGATRQNLLVAQDTANLLATTQNRLSTGKKVNSALDNPTSFFTSQGLDSRSSDLSNLLDSISNGVQVIQAANTGLTSLQKLVDSAKSVANQALQSTIGYSTKSNVSTTITGANAADLRGTTSYASTSAVGNVLFNGTAGGATAASGSTTLGGTAGTYTGSAKSDNAGTAAAISTSTLLYGSTGALTTAANTKFTDGDTLNVNGKTVTFKTAATPAASTLTGTNLALASTGAGANTVTDGSGNSTVYLNTATTVGDVLSAIDVASGVQTVTGSTAGVASLTGTASAITATGTTGTIGLKSSTGADLSVSGKADILNALGLSASTGSGTASLSAVRSVSSASASSLIQDASTLNVNGKTITFKNAPVPSASASHQGVVSTSHLETDGNGNSTVYLQGSTLADVATAIDLATGVQTAALTTSGANLSTTTGTTNSSVVGGALKLSTGTTADLSITGTGNALSSLGLNGSTGTDTSFSASRGALPGGFSGKTLTFASLNGGTAASVTFGDGTNGTVKTLDQLNTKLGANNLSATIDASGKLTIQTTNDHASSTIGGSVDGGAIGGTAASLFSTAAAPVADVNSQNTRSSLLSQFNSILDNIKTTAQDSSFNGVNLLNGDTLKLTFNEKGSSTLNLQGVQFDASGLGLSKLGQNGANEFEDNSATNNVIASLSTASSALRAQASTFGSNLSVVQNRQNFNKSIINVLQTGSSNLTSADLNEEAANSQALSTRNSLTISALSLANQAQQGVLQLLR